MRKSLSVTLSALVFLSMAGCAQRNTARNNNAYRGYNNTDIIQNTRTRRGINRNARNFKDGVYTGYGDMTSSGREMAIVTVRNGRIVDVELTTIDPNSNVTGTTNKTTGINSNTAVGRNNLTGSKNINKDNNNTITDTANNTPRVINRFTRTNTNDRRNYNQDTVNELTRTGNGLTGTLTDSNFEIDNNLINSNRANNLTGTITNTVDQNLTRVRSIFTDSIINNQNYDFDTTNITNSFNDPNYNGYVKNWQLAVRRALDKASR
jgi:uncharacterized protein with FMN-binding domain